ncbi:hypothetical protein PybrP1_008238 [[Pythium] brassicae (nom. inval.)]|nr:hypothetical protein PybrP1_008238 [[Pythium] brassicae (nom. inval.)]
MEGGAGDILALSELITGCQQAFEEEICDAQQRRAPALTPSTIGGAAKAPIVDRPIGQIKAADPKAIWNLADVPSDDEDDTKFEILYKQSVMTEDVFLGLSDKDPSFANCDAMVVRVECPRHRLEDIELDVQKHRLLLQSATLKLSLFLPHPVRHLDGNAKWDSGKQTLSISLPIIRDEW